MPYLLPRTASQNNTCLQVLEVPPWSLLRDVPNTQKPSQLTASRDAPEERVSLQLSRLRKSFLQGLD